MFYVSILVKLNDTEGNKSELKDLFNQKKLINKDNYHSLKWLKKKLKK